MTHLQRVCLIIFANYAALSAAATGPQPGPTDTPACQATQNCSQSASQDITGTILIKKKLTRPSVTPSVSMYQRGTAVALGKDAPENSLAFERSRVVLYLEGPTPTAAPLQGPATLTMQQINRRFAPDLLVVPVGTSVSFPNMDPIFHNIFSLSKPKTFDLGSYDKGETRAVLFSKPGVIYVYCHLHPNMAATIVVTPNRWFARPNGSGQFRIPNVPPGEYTVVAWHKGAGFFRKKIVLEPGRNSVVDFFIPIGDEPQQDAAMKGDSMGAMDGR